MAIYRLDENMITKVADFGLSRDVYITNYYKICQNTPLPVKWLAPEVLIDQVFTTQSDVVSTIIIFNSNCYVLLVVIWSNMLGDIHTGTTTLSYSEQL